MNCRTFGKNLEDYLENGLDFAGRFGMERHAQQCIHCGKEMGDAQSLSRQVHELDKVKAPLDFEASVLNEIGKRKLGRRLPMFRRVFAFGFDMQPWRKYAFAASTLVALGLGSLYFYNLRTSNPSQDPAWTSNNPAILDVETIGESSLDSAANSIASPVDTSFSTDPRFNQLGEGLSVNYHTSESDFGEYTIIGPDNHPIVIPLPNTIKVEIQPPSEEYFIRNVSH